jgi:hypothetical protein
VSRRNHWKLAARNIATNILDGNVLVPQDNTWLRLVLNILHRVSLDFGKAPDVALGILNIDDFLTSTPGQAHLNIGFCESSVRRAIKLVAILI